MYLTVFMVVEKITVDSLSKENNLDYTNVMYYNCDPNSLSFIPVDLPVSNDSCTDYSYEYGLSSLKIFITNNCPNESFITSLAFYLTIAAIGLVTLICIIIAINQRNELKNQIGRLRLIIYKNDADVAYPGKSVFILVKSHEKR